MKLLNPNTPLSNFIYSILNEKNKQIKENILLGDINFPKILFYSKRKEENKFKNTSHILFIKNLNRQLELSEIKEEKTNLEKKVKLTDNQLLSIKNYGISLNNINFNERYLNTNLNQRKSNSQKNSTDKNSSKTKSKSKSKSQSKSLSKSKSKNKKSSSSEKKNKNNNSILPTLGKEKKIKVKNLDLLPIQIKPYKSNSKVNNHETEERLEKNAKAFIQKIKNDKKNLLLKINKKHEKYSLRLKYELEKIERQNKFKIDEFSRNNNIYNIYNNNIYNGGVFNNMDYNNINNINNNKYYYQNLNLINNKKEEDKNSPDNSGIKSNRNKNKKYYYLSPYSSKNPKMLKNISKDLLNFNSELYYNNNMPDILQYQILLAPLYNNNVMNKNGSTRMLNFDEMDNLRNINNINNTNLESVEMTNGDIVGNTSKNNYSNRNDESNIDNSFNKKHLYYFNEPKYEIEVTSPEN